MIQPSFLLQLTTFIGDCQAQGLQKSPSTNSLVRFWKSAEATQSSRHINSTVNIQHSTADVACGWRTKKSDRAREFSRFCDPPKRNARQVEAMPSDHGGVDRTWSDAIDEHI